ESYPPNLQKLMRSFNTVPDPMLRYKQLLFLAKTLPPLPENKMVDANKVPGCTSQVWISVQIDDQRVIINAASDSQLTKGLAALLVAGLSGGSVQSVLNVPPNFIESFGLNQSLTPSRTSGFLNMLQLVKDK
ncbi:Fe-S metabolism associated SufE, partial [Ostreococcus tauri]